MNARRQLPFLAMLAVAVFGPVVAAPAAPPNIVMIFCDDLTMQAISCYGHPLKLLETPNIDRLAREGMRFDRCLVPNSICGPSRAAILTGKYAHLNGFLKNGDRFDGAQPTFPKMLRQAGYQTALIGKWHLETDPTGFDHWHILPGQGAYYNPPMIKDGVPVKHEGYTTDLIGDFSIEWLKARDPAKPFMLMSQHKAPHREWEPALRHLGWSGDRVFPEPATLFDDYAGRGRAEREQDMTFAKSFTKRDSKETPPPTLSPEQRKAWDAYYEPRNEALRAARLTDRDLVRWRYQRFMHDYLGCVKAVDEAVGRMLDYLDAAGLAENTIVVLSSDQGFYLGEHGWFDKRWIYEESLTTPLIVRWPGVVKPGTTSAAMTSILDFPETFLAAAGVAVPAEMQGRSLQPVLAGETPADWRKSFYYHYYEHPGAHNVARHYGVVTDRYKLFHFYEPELNSWTLIDRQEDPQELKNVYADPAHAKARAELHAELERLRAELAVPAADPDTLALPASEDGLPGEGKLRRYDGYAKGWQARREQWSKQVETDRGAVVLLGDSLTAGWGDTLPERFPGMKLANRGIGGDTTRGMLIRLEGDVLALDPAAIVMLAGTNDIEVGIEPEAIVRNIVKIIRAIKEHDARNGTKTPVILCRVLPSAAEKKRPADTVKKLNTLIDDAVRGDPHITVLDTWTLFAAADGNARPAYFPDLLHLNAAGYGRWAAAQRPRFATLGFIETEPDPFVPEDGFESLFNGRDLTGWGFRPTAPRKPDPNPKPGAPVWVDIPDAVAFDGKPASADGRYVAINGRLVVTTPAEGRRIQQLWTTREFGDDFVLRLEFRATPNADSGVFIRQPQLQCRDYALAGPWNDLEKYKPQEWNELEVTVTGAVAKATCNGEPIPGDMQVPPTGPIGLEGDRGQMEYRRIRFKPR